MSASGPIHVRFRQGKHFGRLLFAFLLLCSIAVGVAAGLLFVYQLDLPEVRALEDFRPNVVTELYGDDGQVIGSFALQRRILLDYEQIPEVLKDAVVVTEDQNFYSHWGIDMYGVARAAWANIRAGRITEGASTVTMQLAGVLFLDRSDRSPRRKIQEALLAVEIERRYSKEQILTFYANQMYLAHGNYGFEAAAQYYFGKRTTDLELHEAALIAALLRGPVYSPLLNPRRAQGRRDYVISRLRAEGKITPQQAQEAAQKPLGLNITAARNDLAPYFIEEIRQYLERTYGTESVHERGLRVYTTLNADMQRAANHAVRSGLHAYERRRGWRGRLTNILKEKNAETSSANAKLGALEEYKHHDWGRSISVGDYITGLVTAVDDRAATVKFGKYRALVTPADFRWTGRRAPGQLFTVGDLAVFRVLEISGEVLRVELEQKPRPQAALLAIENSTGEIKAMVGGYSFEESKFNRATQALRQVGSSFKPYLYTTALEMGYTPFDTIVDAPFTTTSGGEEYSPRNYDEKFEGRITLRRALIASRNVPAVKLAELVDVNNVVQTTRRFGVTSPLPPYLPMVLGAPEITVLEHTAAFTVFPNEGLRITPHMIRRVTTYDGSVLEEARPRVIEAIDPGVARTMTALLQEVVQYGTGVRARELKRPLGGKTGTANDYSNAWFVGFSPSLTAGVWVGHDDNRISLGRKETGARAALPIWMEFMAAVLKDQPVEEFANVESMAHLALTHHVQVDTPDTAPAARQTAGEE